MGGGGEGRGEGEEEIKRRSNIGVGGSLLSSEGMSLARLTSGSSCGVTLMSNPVPMKYQVIN